MGLKDLYEVIRKEDVCLWIGAGFSMYAGYPSVREIKDLLYEQLTFQEQGSLDLNKSLAGFTSDFVILKDRSVLVDVLQRRFKEGDSSGYYHQLLSKIAHVKTLITTNYDHLIEDSYTRKGIAIKTVADVPLISHNLTKIFKIHGDIDLPESIVITREDYSALYNRNFKNPFWTAVLNEMATKHIIFLGYGYEDENVWADFDYIDKKLVNNNKRRFMIGRTLSPLMHKRLEQLNIEFIESSFEEFVPALVEELKKNLPADLRNGYINTSDAQDFISGFDLKYAIQSTQTGSEIISISKPNGEMNFEVSVLMMDENTKEAFRRFMNNEELELKIEREQLIDFSLMNEGFELLDFHNMQSFSFITLPGVSGTCSIAFCGHDFELDNLQYEIYTTRDKVIVKVVIEGFNLELSGIHVGGSGQMNFKITEPENASSITSLIKVFQALVLAAEQKEMLIYPTGKQMIRKTFPKLPIAREFKRQLEIFTALKKIERAFQVKFGNMKVSEVTDGDINVIVKLMQLIEQGYYAVKEEEGITILDLPDDQEFVAAIQSPIPERSEVYVEKPSTWKTKLFGVLLDCGIEQLIMLNPKLIHFDQSERFATFLPSNKVIVYRYEKFGLKQPQNATTLWRAKKSNI